MHNGWKIPQYLLDRAFLDHLLAYFVLKLRRSATSIDLKAGKLKRKFGFLTKESSLFPRLSIFKPKAHLAIPSMEKALNVLQCYKKHRNKVNDSTHLKTMGDVITSCRQFCRLSRLKSRHGHTNCQRNL